MLRRGIRPAGLARLSHSSVPLRHNATAATDGEAADAAPLSFANLTAAAQALQQQGATAAVSGAAVKQLAAQIGIANAADIRAALIDTVQGSASQSPYGSRAMPTHRWGKAEGDGSGAAGADEPEEDKLQVQTATCRASRWVFLCTLVDGTATLYCPFQNKIVATLPNVADSTEDDRLAFAKLMTQHTGTKNAVALPVAGNLGAEHAPTLEASRALEAAMHAVGISLFVTSTAEAIFAAMKMLPKPTDLTPAHVTDDKRASGLNPTSALGTDCWLSHAPPTSVAEFQKVWAYLRLATRQRQQLPSQGERSRSLEGHMVDCVAPAFTFAAAHLAVTRTHAHTRLNFEMQFLSSGQTLKVTDASVADLAEVLTHEASKRPIVLLNTYSSDTKILRMVIGATKTRVLLLPKPLLRREFSQALTSPHVSDFMRRLMAKMPSRSRTQLIEEVSRATGTIVRALTALSPWEAYDAARTAQERELEDHPEDFEGMVDFAGVDDVMVRVDGQDVSAEGAADKQTSEADDAAGEKGAIEDVVSRADANAAAAIKLQLEEPSARARKYLAPLHDERRVAAEQAAADGLKSYICAAIVGTNRMRHRRAGNPTSLSNHVAMIALRDHTGATLPPLRIGSRRGELKLPPLDGYDVLVLHHAKSALLLLAGPEDNTADPELKRFLARGGKVWCTAVGEYLLGGFRAADANLVSLDSIGCQYGVAPVQAPFAGGDSRTQDASMASADGGQATSTTIVTTGGPAIMTPRPTRSTTTEERAAANTALDALVAAFEGQRARALTNSQLLSCCGRMDALLAFTAMERNGLFVHRERLLAQAGEAKNNWLESVTLLDLMLPKQLPVDTSRKTFSWHAPNHVSAVFFGGDIKIGASAPRRERPELSVAHAQLFTELGYQSNTLGLLVHNPCLRLYADAEQLQVNDTKNIVDTIRTYIATKDHGRRRRKPEDAEEGAEAEQLPSAPTEYRPGHTKFRVVVMDLESTGLSSHGDRIVEMAFLDPVEDQCFSALVNPKCLIPIHVTALHKITNGMVKSMPSFAGYLPQLQRFLRIGRYRRPDEVLILVGHNSSGLDEPLLRQHFSTCGAPIDESHVLFADSLPMMRQRRSQFKFELGSFRLPQIVKLLGIEKKYQQQGQELHRAETDVRLLWDVLGHLTGTIRQPGAVRHAEVLRLMAETLQQADDSCFSARSEMSTQAKVVLPGQMERLFGADAAKKRRELMKLPVLSEAVLGPLTKAGSKEAGLLKRALAAERRINAFLELDETGRDGALVHNDGAIRQDLRQMATSTGRTSSAFPNCQSIPNVRHSRLREIFVSRFEENGVVVELDYRQLEMLVSLLLTQDPVLREEHAKGIDWHLKSTAVLADSTYEDVKAKYDKGDAAIVKLREAAKQLNFMSLYGAGGKLIERMSALSAEKVGQAQMRLLTEYKDAFSFVETTREALLRRDNPGLPTHHILELPTGARLCVPPKDAAKMTPLLRNLPVQAYAAEVVQLAVGQLFRELQTTDHFGGRALLVNFVHDSVWFDCHVDVVDQLVPLASKVLGNVKEQLLDRYPGITSNVDFSVKAKIGSSLFDLRAYKAPTTPQ